MEQSIAEPMDSTPVAEMYTTGAEYGISVRITLLRCCSKRLDLLMTRVDFRLEQQSQLLFPPMKNEDQELMFKGSGQV